MKAFNTMTNVGKARHVVNSHDGVKTHKDGSPFFDISVFDRKRDAQRLVRDLKAVGYVEGNGADVRAASAAQKVQAAA